MKSRARALLPLAALGPVVMVAHYVATRGNVAPGGDQWWDVVYIAIKTKAGLLTLQDLLVDIGGHRPVVIRLLTVLATWLTDYDVRILRFTAFGTALISLVLCSLLLARTHRRLLPFAIPLFALVLCTLHTPDSWLDYYYACWQQPLLFLLLGLFALQRMRPGALAFALVVLCAVATTFTLGLGPAAWFSLPVAFLANRSYRRWYYVVVWIALAALCIGFYASPLLRGPVAVGASLSFDGLRPERLWETLGYLVGFQSVRFDMGAVSPTGMLLTILCVGAMVTNAWELAWRGRQSATVGSWLALAAFAGVGAGVAILGRGGGGPVPARYGPGADGFWIAVVALGLLGSESRPRSLLAASNVALLALLACLTIQKDLWLLGRPGCEQCENPSYVQSCDQCVQDYPSTRSDCFGTCFWYAEEQSVYLMAALRLSVFRDDAPRLVLPESDVVVITDMPHRWLSVYVRDYMLKGVAPENVRHIAPARAKLHHSTWAANGRSPFYREWSTDTLPRPLGRTWETWEALAAEVPTLLIDQRKVWYINTPETEAHFPGIEQGFAEHGWTGKQIPIGEPRFVGARFGLWCFEAPGSGACPGGDVEHAGGHRDGS